MSTKGQHVSIDNVHMHFQEVFAMFLGGLSCRRIGNSSIGIKSQMDLVDVDEGAVKRCCSDVCWVVEAVVDIFL